MHNAPALGKPSSLSAASLSTFSVEPEKFRGCALWCSAPSDLHVAEYSGEGLPEVLHRVFRVLALALGLAALPMERHSRGRRLFLPSANGRCAAHGAGLRG
ncbi:hypothetical protein KM043_012644 [Ampulex compressa]|nr:hypothetical protein KM043_012644 [Ampulex compressa]